MVTMEILPYPGKNPHCGLVVRNAVVAPYQGQAVQKVSQERKKLIKLSLSQSLCFLNSRHVSGVKRPSSGGTTLAVLVYVARSCRCWQVASYGETGLLALGVWV
jgi:hypothetical protein